MVWHHLAWQWLCSSLVRSQNHPNINWDAQCSSRRLVCNYSQWPVCTNVCIDVVHVGGIVCASYVDDSAAIWFHMPF